MTEYFSMILSMSSLAPCLGTVCSVSEPVRVSLEYLHENRCFQHGMAINSLGHLAKVMIAVYHSNMLTRTVTS